MLCGSMAPNMTWSATTMDTTTPYPTPGHHRQTQKNRVIAFSALATADIVALRPPSNSVLYFDLCILFVLSFSPLNYNMIVL